MALMFQRLARNFANNGYFPTDAKTHESQDNEELMVCNPELVKTALEDWVIMVKKYDSMGYYPLVKPEFISEVLLGALSNIKLTKEAVIADNSYQNIGGYSQCNRVFQLSSEMKTQILKRLHGYLVSYQADNWEILSVESIDNS